MIKIKISFILLAFFIGLFLSCSQSNVEKYDKEVPYKWLSLEYSYFTGSVGPPYYSHYLISINPSSLKGNIEYVINYGGDNSKSLKYDISVKDSNMMKLNKLLIASELFDKEIPSESKIPMGASNKSVKVTLRKKDKEGMYIIKQSPSYPKSEYKEKLDTLYSFINSLVPSNIWNEIETEKKEYIDNYKN